jgi:hypothetical protein
VGKDVPALHSGVIATDMLAQAGFLGPGNAKVGVQSLFGTILSSEESAASMIAIVDKETAAGGVRFPRLRLGWPPASLVII